MTGRPDWRSSRLFVATLVGIALAAIAGFDTIDTPLPRNAKAPIVTAQLAPPAPAAEIKLPTADPPPAPTGTDFGAKPADAPAPSTPEATRPAAATDWASLPIEELRTRANAREIAAMEEIARRLIQGVGVPKDPQAGAGWLLRAATAGSAQAAFNVGVMYERGFVVERDPSRAVEWYRKAADGNMPAAKHNLALLLRDGKGAPRDVKRAIELLRSAAQQGMAASMFSLGDIYERDAGPKDPATALAWFTIAAEFERQINRGEATPLAKAAEQRSQALQRALTAPDQQRAQQLGQAEFRAIVEALAPPAKARRPPVEPAAPPVATLSPAPAPARVDLPSWPTTPAEQVRAIQQALADLRLLRDQPDGVLGPMTRNAIRDFQRSAGLQASGEPGKEVYAALRQALIQRDIVANSPLPLPPKEELPKSEPTNLEPAPAAAIDLGTPEPPPPPTSAELARFAAASGRDAWPADSSDQVKAIQDLLRDLKLLTEAADGQNGPATRGAIRQYERLAGLRETGEPTKALFESLKETRALMAPKNRSY